MRDPEHIQVMINICRTANNAGFTFDEQEESVLVSLENLDRLSRHFCEGRFGGGVALVLVLHVARFEQA